MSKEPYQKKKQEPNLNLVSAKRVYWSSGLLFGLLMLLVLSGLASITLLYDGIPSAENIRGTEGVVLDIVRTLRPAIRFIHEFGGFAAIFLSGWLAVELVRFGRNARAHGTAKKREKHRAVYYCHWSAVCHWATTLPIIFDRHWHRSPKVHEPRIRYRFSASSRFKAG